MAFRYPIYTHRNDPQVFYDSLGALILLGGMTLILGTLIMYHELMVIGSGVLILASLCQVCTMDQYYYQQRYEGVDTRELDGREPEVPEVSE